MAATSTSTSGSGSGSGSGSHSAPASSPSKGSSSSSSSSWTPNLSSFPFSDTVKEKVTTFYDATLSMKVSVRTVTDSIKENRVVEFGLYCIDSVKQFPSLSDTIDYLNEKAKILSSKKREEGSSEAEEEEEEAEISLVKKELKNGSQLVPAISKKRDQVLALINDNVNSGLSRVQRAQTMTQQSFSTFVKNALDFISEARQSTPRQVVTKILYYLADAMQQHKRAQVNGVYKVCLPGPRSPPRALPSHMPVTGIVISYREHHDAGLTMSMRKRIQRSMHHDLSLRPFDATIKLVPPESGGLLESGDVDFEKYEDEIAEHEIGKTTCTPQSFPASPCMRSAVLADYSSFTEDILFRARDELRVDYEHDYRPRLATFNPNDSHDEIKLSCGSHCASKEGTGLYRSVRAALPIPEGVLVYFEMNIMEGAARHRDSVSSIEFADDVNGTEDAEDELSVCVGLSMRSVPLNALVGSVGHSISFHSSGHLLQGSVWSPAVLAPTPSSASASAATCSSDTTSPKDAPRSKSSNQESTASAAFGCGSTIGVCVRLHDSHKKGMWLVKPHFFIDGRLVRPAGDAASPAEMHIPWGAEIFPTLSLYTPRVRVFGHFAAGDVLYAQRKYLSPVAGCEPVFSLDGGILL